MLRVARQLLTVKYLLTAVTGSAEEQLNIQNLSTSWGLYSSLFIYPWKYKLLGGLSDMTTFPPAISYKRSTYVEVPALTFWCSIPRRILYISSDCTENGNAPKMDNLCMKVFKRRVVNCCLQILQIMECTSYWISISKSILFEII